MISSQVHHALNTFPGYTNIIKIIQSKLFLYFLFHKSALMPTLLPLIFIKKNIADSLLCDVFLFLIYFLNSFVNAANSSKVNASPRIPSGNPQALIAL